MKSIFTCTMAIALAAGVASADVYTDATGEIFDLGFSHLDIGSVTITNDATDLHIQIQTMGDLDATNWGKYALGIDTGMGPSDNSNAWGRNIDWARGITHWIATWANDGGSGIGGEVYNWDGASWGTGTGLSGSNDAMHGFGIQMFSISLADLGVGVGDTIEFDVITTGGGADPGVDHLSRSDMATPGWGDTSVSGTFLSYTLVPTPGTMALLGLGGLTMVRRRR